MNGIHSDGWGWGFFGHGFGLLFWIIAIALVVALVMGLRGGNGSGNRPSARDVLKERYAKGEIDRDEYERKMKDLDL